MTRPRLSPKKMIGYSFLTLRQILPYAVVFELIYKLLITVIFRPVISYILSTTVRLSGFGIAFNADIWRFILSPIGVIALLLMAVLAALVTYFEFAFIILLTHNQYMQMTLRPGYILKQTLATMGVLRSPGLLGFCLYTLVVLPFVNLGITSSLIPTLSLPNIVSSFLSGTPWGGAVLLLLSVLGLFLAQQLIYQLPIMVLEKKRFWPAFKRSRSTLRKTNLRILVVFGVVLAVWGLAMVLPTLMIRWLTGLDAGAGLGEILAATSLPWQAILSALSMLTISAAQMVLMPVVLSLIVIAYLETDGQVQLDVKGLIQIDRRLRRMGNKLGRKWKRLRERGGRMWRYLNQQPFFLRHRFKLAILLLALMGGTIWLLYPTVVPWDDPVVIGHRGSLVGVENTLEAIQGAIDAGAEFAEIDILLTADNIPVVLHDANLKRLTGQNLQAANLTAAEICAIPLLQNGYESRIPTLAQVLEYCNGKIRLLIEYKLHGRETVSIVDAAMAVVAEYGFEEQCIFQAMDYPLIVEMKEKYPEAIIGYVAYGNVGKVTASRLSAFDVDFLSMEQDFVNKNVVNACRRAWIPIYVWTTNTAEDLETYLEMGVSGVITDYPALAKSIWAEIEGK